jgi:hypothetical protein
MSVHLITAEADQASRPTCRAREPDVEPGTTAAGERPYRRRREERRGRTRRRIRPRGRKRHATPFPKALQRMESEKQTIVESRQDILQTRRKDPTENRTRGPATAPGIWARSKSRDWNRATDPLRNPEQRPPFAPQSTKHRLRHHGQLSLRTNDERPREVRNERGPTKGLPRTGDVKEATPLAGEALSGTILFPDPLGRRSESARTPGRSYDC